ncbi:Hypothetical predicted protein [Prunus dulcis]|uniref:Uncharacterized protein n=1 Tax=Prunus dulcis TaxID=3755 RepID=A0A5E4FSP3_PRUDU|nr:Hypothetical predicted protein [Prunus dulcis]
MIYFTGIPDEGTLGEPPTPTTVHGWGILVNINSLLANLRKAEDSAQQIAATSSFYVVVFLSVRSAGNFWSRLQLPASVLPLFEIL